jgi:hypothetical protein
MEVARKKQKKEVKQQNEKESLYSLAKPLLKMLVDYLCWVDAYAFRCSSKAFKSCTKQPSLSRTIANYLALEGVPNPEKFCTILKKNQVWMAGSFVLSALFGFSLDWKPNDIDLWMTRRIHFTTSEDAFIKELGAEPKNVNEKHNYLTHGCLLESAYFGWKKHPNSEDELLYPKYNDLSINWLVVNPLALPTTSKTSQKKKDFQEYINWSFDLDICTVAFDGDEIYISNIVSLWHRATRFDFESYTQRKQSVYERWPPSQERQWSRLVKYAARGFSIRVQWNAQLEPFWLFQADLKMPLQQMKRSLVVRMPESQIQNEFGKEFLMDLSRTDQNLNPTNHPSSTFPTHRNPRKVTEKVGDSIEVCDFEGADWKLAKILSKHITHFIVQLESGPQQHPFHVNYYDTCWRPLKMG